MKTKNRDRRLWSRAAYNSLLVVLLYTSTLAAQSSSSQVELYGFQDIHLGMSIAEFKTKHPAPIAERYGQPSPLPGQALCSAWNGEQQGNNKKDATEEVTRCDYKESFLNIALRVSTIFFGGKVAVIEVEPPYDTPACFEPLTPPGTSSPVFGCEQYPSLSRALTDKLGLATHIVSMNENLKDALVLRWENDLSVAEFQAHMCGPWGTDGGWAKAISEVLEGSYCGHNDSLSYRQSVMLYIHKKLGRTLAIHLLRVGSAHSTGATGTQAAKNAGGS
jgi:hypothetical protein